jgi:hypothetical protein
LGKHIGTLGNKERQDVFIAFKVLGNPSPCYRTNTGVRKSEKRIKIQAKKRKKKYIKSLIYYETELAVVCTVDENKKTKKKWNDGSLRASFQKEDYSEVALLMFMILMIFVFIKRNAHLNFVSLLNYAFGLEKVDRWNSL